MDNRKPLIVGQHYPAIDGLRGFAVLMVVWFHASYFSYELNPVDYHGFTQIYYYLSILGETGVDLFFVLSGFLITGILIDTAEDEHKFKNFYIRRSLRIFPLYYAVLFLFIIYVSVSQGYEILDLRLIAHIFYVQNWSYEHNVDSFMLLNHTWSLAVEEQFYLIWPVLFLTIYKRSVKHIVFLCLTLTIMSWVLRFSLSGFEYYKQAYSMTICRLDNLTLGALLSVFCVHYRDKVSENYALFRISAIVSFILILITLFSSTTVMIAHNLQIKIGLTFFSIFYVCLLAYLFLADEQNLLKQFFSLTLLRKVGKVSYGMYIFHSPILLLIAQNIFQYELPYWHAHLLLLFAGGGLSYLFAALSYKFYEKPFLKLKEKYAPLNTVSDRGINE